MGFPLHQGTVECGPRHLPLAPRPLRPRHGLHPRPLGRRRPRLRVTIDGDDVLVEPRRGDDPVAHLFGSVSTTASRSASRSCPPSRCSASSKPASPPDEIVREASTSAPATATPAGAPASPCSSRWPTCSPTSTTDDRALALVHGLAFVARDTRNRPPALPDRLRRSQTVAVPRADRLATWYRRFVDTRTADAAERVLDHRARRDRVPSATSSAMMFAAVTDHVFVDGGHTHRLHEQGVRGARLRRRRRRRRRAARPSCARPRRPRWSEENGEWRHPHDLAALVDATQPRLDAAVDAGATRHGDVRPTSPGSRGSSSTTTPTRRRRPARRARPPAPIPTDRPRRSRTPPRCASPASTPRTTSATGTPSTTRSPPPTRCTTRSCACRPPSCCAARCTARCASTSTASSTCPRHGCPTRSRRPRRPRRVLRSAGRGRRRRQRRRTASCAAEATAAQLVAALGHALLAEDAEFHWFQVFEAGVRQATLWPDGSEESASGPRRPRPVPLRAHPDPPRTPDASCASPPACAAAKPSTKPTDIARAQWGARAGQHFDACAWSSGTPTWPFIANSTISSTSSRRT